MAMDISCSKREFLLELSKNFFMLKVVNIGTRAQRGCEISIVGDIQNLKEKALSNLSKLSLIFKGVEQMICKGPFQLKIFYIPVVLECCIYR